MKYPASLRHHMQRIGWRKWKWVVTGPDYECIGRGIAETPSGAKRAISQAKSQVAMRYMAEPTGGAVDPVYRLRKR